MYISFVPYLPFLGASATQDNVTQRCQLGDVLRMYFAALFDSVFHLHSPPLVISRRSAPFLQPCQCAHISNPIWCFPCPGGPSCLNNPAHRVPFTAPWLPSSVALELPQPTRPGVFICFFQNEIALAS